MQIGGRIAATPLEHYILNPPFIVKQDPNNGLARASSWPKGIAKQIV